MADVNKQHSGSRDARKVKTSPSNVIFLYFKHKIQIKVLI